MTDRGVFTGEEWDLLVRLPRWVVAAASAAQPDSAQRTHTEVEAGFIAVADGRELGDDLVRDIAQASMGAFDKAGDDISFTAPEVDRDAGRDTAPEAGRDTALEAGLDTVLARIGDALRLLRAKAQPAPVAAYGRWLLNITDVVINAARSGDVLGFGGVVVTEAEQRFRDRVEQTLRG